MPQNQTHGKVEIELQRHWGCLPYPTLKEGKLLPFSVSGLFTTLTVSGLIREMPFIQSALGGILCMVWYHAGFLKFLFLPTFLPLLLPSLSPCTCPTSLSCSVLSNSEIVATFCPCSLSFLLPPPLPLPCLHSSSWLQEQ